MDTEAVVVVDEAVTAEDAIEVEACINPKKIKFNTKKKLKNSIKKPQKKNVKFNSLHSDLPVKKISKSSRKRKHKYVNMFLIKRTVRPHYRVYNKYDNIYKTFVFMVFRAIKRVNTAV